MPYKDPVKYQAYQEEYHANIICLGLSMILAGVINDPKIWHCYCNRKRRRAKQSKKPFSDDFTDEIFFEKMKDGCIYCGDLADTIDRLNSSLGHTPDNCVGCCHPCNVSKSNGDPDSFVRRAYYRSRGKHFDDIKDIWSDNEIKPNINKSKSKSQKQQRPFTLTQDEWNALIIGDYCAYCHRSRPDNKWNGVDRIIPVDGYTLDNTVTCCHDCNVDKGELSVEDMKKRNENIARRLENRIIILFDCETSLRIKKYNEKKVCVYGRVYPSYINASKTLEKSYKYIANCLYYKRYPDDIFEITNEFYEFVMKNNLENITKKMYILFNRM
jgi:hypothetical protein